MASERKALLKRLVKVSLAIVCETTIDSLLATHPSYICSRTLSTPLNSNGSVDGLLSEVKSVTVQTSTSHSTNGLTACVPKSNLCYYAPKCMDTIAVGETMNPIAVGETMNPIAVGETSTYGKVKRAKSLPSRTLKPEDSVTCETCSLVVASKGHLMRHKVAHTANSCFRCRVCDASFTRKIKLMYHLERAHGVSSIT